MKTGNRPRRGWGSRGSPVVLGIRLDCRNHQEAYTGRSSDRKPETGSSMGKGTLVRGGPSRWRAGGPKRIRRVARKRVARDRECQRSSVSSARGRQRRGGVVHHLPSGYDRRDRSSSRGVNRRGTRAERAARRERRSKQAERPGSDEARRKPRIRELGEFRVLVKEVSCRSRWKHLLRARSA